ncbi:MAG: GNAT family N-acetyltransferase [Planctomycetota bacterium]|nr:GNAT family N-acetyltransferase [Planctomycetota bacterium]
MRKLTALIAISCFCAATMWVLFAADLGAQSTYPFVSSDFKVPEQLETEKFRLRMLTVNDVVKDYDAVMTSVARLKKVFGPNTNWPTGLTFEQDLIDLGWHHKEFQRRRSFAYTVMSPTESQCIGCVYINPTRKRGYDAAVYLWVRDSEFEKGLDPILFNAVKEWIANDWPFRKVAYPGRTVDWESWEAIQELPR